MNEDSFYKTPNRPQLNRSQKSAIWLIAWLIDSLIESFIWCIQYVQGSLLGVRDNPVQKVMVPSWSITSPCREFFKLGSMGSIYIKICNFRSSVTFWNYKQNYIVFISAYENFSRNRFHQILEGVCVVVISATMRGSLLKMKANKEENYRNLEIDKITTSVGRHSFIGS